MSHTADEVFVTEGSSRPADSEPVLPRSAGGLDLGFLLLLAGRAVQRAVDDAACNLGMTPMDLVGLHVVAVHDGLTGAALARGLGLQQSTITAVADRLEAAGLIERCRDSADRRKVWLRRTDKGAEVLLRARSTVRTPLQDLISPLDRRAAEHLANLLGQVIEPQLTRSLSTPGTT